MGGILVFSNRIFSGSSRSLIIFNIVFSINVTRATQNSRRRQNPENWTRLLMNNLIFPMVQYHAMVRGGIVRRLVRL